MVALVQSPPASPRGRVSVPTREQLRAGTAPALSIAPLGRGPEDASAKKWQEVQGFKAVFIDNS